MSTNKDLIKRLRTPDSSGHPPSKLELEAAGVIESLEFQLSARIGVARAEEREKVGA